MSNNSLDFLKKSIIEKEINHLFQEIPVSFSLEIYQKILEFIDLTSLNDNDTEESIREICTLAKNIRTTINSNAIASVCVYPKFVKQVRSELQNTGICVASVAGNFPTGKGSLDEKLYEVKYAIDQGAQEIDYVISKEYVSSKSYDSLYEEIHSVKNICGDILLKTILETGEIQSTEEIFHVSKTAIEAGADFIKTSTGKTPIGVTPISAYVMLKTIEEYYQKTGKQVGFKASGGISNPEQAIQYYYLANNILSAEKLDKNTFRIGASRLVGKLLELLS